MQTWIRYALAVAVLGTLAACDSATDADADELNIRKRDGGSADGGDGIGRAGRGGASGQSGSSGSAGRGGSSGSSGSDAGRDDGGASNAGRGGSKAPRPPHCLDGISDYASPGPFTFTMKTSGMVRIRVPDVPADCKVPVIHFAPGTNETCNGLYRDELDHLASHGFLTVCYEQPASGSGEGCVSALQTAFEEFPELADAKIGSAGHLEGGSGALVCLQNAKEIWKPEDTTYAGLAASPMSGFGASPSEWEFIYEKLHLPVFMFHSTGGMVVSPAWVGGAFGALDPSSEAYWDAAVGATDTPPPATWIEEGAVAWFRWKLLDDVDACRAFHAFPETGRWDLTSEQSPTPCE